MLETIRQYGNERLIAAGDANEVRYRHAAFFAREAERQWNRWDGREQEAAIEWLLAELANLRAGFGWAHERGDVATATAIAAHAAMIGPTAQRWEPVDWAVDTVETATAAGVPQLPRLLTAASYCEFLGRPEEALEYAEAAVRLEAAGGHDPFAAGWSAHMAAIAHFNPGRRERAFERLADELSGQELDARIPPTHPLPLDAHRRKSIRGRPGNTGRRAGTRPVAARPALDRPHPSGIRIGTRSLGSRSRPDAAS
jgi:hypothetical protein